MSKKENCKTEMLPGLTSATTTNWRDIVTWMSENDFSLYFRADKFLKLF